MLPRERVLMALRHKAPDRVPLDFWATPEIWGKLYTHFNTKSKRVILEKLNVDIRDYKPDYIGPKMPTLEDGTFYEPMGTHRRFVSNEYSTYDEYASAPLGYINNISDFNSYKWFSADDYDYNSLSEKIGTVSDTYATKLMVGGLFELAWGLRGYEQFLIDMYENPEVSHFIMNKITEFYCQFIDRSMAATGDKLDLIFSYDDIATQRSMLMSLPMWEEFIKPYHIRMNAVAQKYNKPIIYHTCGNVYNHELLMGLSQMGVDVLNPIQMCGEMTLEELKNEYGSIFSFHGGVDIQKSLPNLSPKQVREVVNKLISVMGKDGGFILTSTHYIQNDTPVENIIAMYEEASGEVIN